MLGAVAGALPTLFRGFSETLPYLECVTPPCSLLLRYRSKQGANKDWFFGKGEKRRKSVGKDWARLRLRCKDGTARLSPSAGVPDESVIA